MHSGKDVAYPTQWALNPTAYQNMDSSQVDWAALAQQWIAMKEAAVISAPPPPPPPETDSGEAPMEVENPDAQADVSSVPANVDWESNSNSWGSWNQWGWGWPGAGPMDPKLMPDSRVGVQPMMDSFVEPSIAAVIPGYSTGTGPAATFQHGYWTASQPEENASEYKTNDHKRSRSSNKDKSSRQHRSQREKVPMVPAVIDPMAMAVPIPTLDAAKRRQLPAWIREGLEKMEREKQKALEREQELKAKEEMEKEQKKLEEKELLRIKAEAEGNPLPPAKSKFESESEAEDSEREEEEKIIEDDPPQESSKQIDEREQSPLVKKTPEEIMQEVMIAVRRSLTEILLEVTDQEIKTVCREELARYNSAQATSVTVMKAGKSNALAAITSGLGLGAYESSSGESDEDDDDLSDQKLKELIRRRQLEWEEKAREIEDEASPRRPPTPATPHTPRTSRSSMTPPPIDTGHKEKNKEHHNSCEKTKQADRKTPERDYIQATPSPKRTSNNKSNDSNSSSSDSESSNSESDSSKSSRESKNKKYAKKNKKTKRKSSSSSEREIKSKKNRNHKEKESKVKNHNDADKTEKSRKSNGDDDYKKAKRKGDDRQKDKYDEDYRRKRRRSRSPSYESRSSRRKSSRDRDWSEDRYRKREKKSYDRDRSYDRYSRDKYERSRDYDRQRSRSSSRHRHRR